MRAAQEEYVGSNDQTLVMKRKRTKRQRSSSPFGVAMSTSSSSSGCGGGGGGAAAEDCYYSVFSPTTSEEISQSTEEEEDMANCLIMLARGDGPRRVNIDEDVKMEKFNSRKFSEIATNSAATTTKAGFYVYECKTCNRSFPSFQALGGHRASHKKPKAITEEKKTLALPAENHHDPHNHNPVLALQVSNNENNRTFHSTNNKQGKIHECSICGSEFTSGQALGGHMRRHRAAAAGNQTAVSMDTSGATVEYSTNGSDDIKQRNVLELDLNLPAPEVVDDLRDSKFQFGASQQALVFSAPALIDCHY